MKKFFVFIIAAFSMVSLLSGQCVFPPIDNEGLICDEAQYMCGYELDGYTDVLPVENLLGDQPLPGCPNQGEVDNITWFSFVADDTNLEIHIDFANCFGGLAGVGLQAGIYSSCDFEQEKVACKTVFSYQTVILAADPFVVVPGEIYYLYIDGYGGGICDYTINVIDGVCTDLPEPTVDCEIDCGVSNSYGDGVGCTGFAETYTMATLEQQINDMTSSCYQYSSEIDIRPIACVEWEILPNTGVEFNILSDNPQYIDSLLERPSITVEWLEPGVYTIRPIISYNPRIRICDGGCDCPLDLAYTVTVSETQVVNLPDIEICPGDCVDFCGTTYCDEATINCYDRDNCIQEIQQIFLKQIQFVDLGDYYICEGSCFDFNGVSYCTPNLFSVPDGEACDTSYVFELLELDIQAELAEHDSVLNCSVSTIDLIGHWVTNYPGAVNVFWLAENGDTVSFTDTYTANTAGTYEFHVVPEDNILCGTIISQEITLDDDVPEVNFDAPFLDCYNDEDSITNNTTHAIQSMIWSGPDGFSSTELTPTIQLPGTYEVEILGVNGCVTNETVLVSGDFDAPEVLINYDNIDCSENVPLAQYDAMTVIDSIKWISPNGDITIDDILTLQDAGDYTLQVWGNNGCFSEEFFEVEDMSYDPSLQLMADKEWTCGDEEYTIDISGDVNQGTEYSWSSLDGSFEVEGDNIIITSTGQYILTAFDPELGCMGHDTINIVDFGNPLSTVTLDITQPVCYDGSGGSISLIDTEGGEEPFTYVIDNVVFDNLDAIELEGGNHIVQIIDANDCMVEESIEIITPDAPVIELEEELVVKYGKKYEIECNYNIDDDQVAEINWYDQSDEFLNQGKIYQFIWNGEEEITAELIDTNGCVVEASIRILIDYEVDIYYPNIFSPNGDGQNDNFILFNNGNPERMDALQIYDRAGELIYQNTGLAFNEMSAGWDGTFNGKPVVPGVYVFLMKYTLGNGQARSMSGSITVVR